MLVNHVTEETKPNTFAAPHLRRLVRIIQDPDEVKISDAYEAWRNSKGCICNRSAYEDYVDVCREVEGDAYYLKPTEEERERELKKKETEEICLAINTFSNSIATEIKELKDSVMKMREVLKEVVEKFSTG